MRLYRWKARSSGGKAYNGEYFANDEKQVIDFVHRNYGYVTDIEKARETVSFHHWFQPRWNFSSKERAGFYKQLSTLLDAGIPIIKAIEMLAVGLSGKCRPVCYRLILGLQSGRTLSQSMALQPDIFSDMNVSVVEAGEACGQVSSVLISLSEFYKQQDKLLKLARNVCIYPAFLLLISFLAFIFFNYRLVPLFSEMYRSLGVRETPLLQILLSFSGLLQNHAVALSCVCIAGGKLILLYREKILTLTMKMPVISPLRHSFLEIRFVRLLALMIRSGISFPEAVRRSSVTLTDLAMKNNATKFSENVLRGVGITEAAVQAGTLFSKTGVEFLRIGESSGTLPDMLEEYAGIQEQELFARLRDVKAILEPALVTVVSVVLFAMITVMLSPLFTLMTQMPEYD